MDTDTFNNEPLLISILIHCLPSSSTSCGMQSLVIQDTANYEEKLCRESYQHYGVPCPATKDPTVKWLKPNKSVVFMQAAGKAMPFVSFEKSMTDNRLILTTAAYIRLLNFFGGQHESEWTRLEKKMRLQLDSMKTNTLPINLVSTLSFVGPGCSQYTKIIQKQEGWNLMLNVFGKSSWNKEAPLEITLRYTPTATSFESLGPARNNYSIRLNSQVMMALSTQAAIKRLSKYNNPLGYFTSMPVVALQSLGVGSPSKKRKKSELLKSCGLDSSSSSEEGTDNYSVPVLTAKAAAAVASAQAHLI